MHRRELIRLMGLASFAPALRSLPDALTQQPDVELELTAGPGEVNVLPGAPTRVWRFTGRVLRGPATALQTIPGSYLGPVIRLRRGQHGRIRFQNRLEESSIVHWHGLDVPAAADGHPRLAVDAGGTYDYDFEVTNRAGTYWYHPHPHMRTGPQVYQGLAGLLIVTDPEEDALELPAGAGELLCILQDRRFDAANQLVYAQNMTGGMAGMMQTMNGWLGDRLLVNGRAQPTIDVDRRTYRVRILNASNARIYKLAWSDGTPLTVMGGDGGLLEQARTMKSLTLATGQRADVLLDLSDQAAGSTVELRSVEFPAEAIGRAGMMAAASPLPQGAPISLMTLRLSDQQGPRVSLPARLSAPSENWSIRADAPVRRVALGYRQMNWLLAGRTFEMEGADNDETVTAGSTHVWELANETNPMGMMMAHPVHLHGRQFRVLSRSGAESNPLAEGLMDSGPTDTVLVLPGETVRLQVTFSRHPGLYLYHCHILEHEDMGMMRNFRIT
jgi:FtsP/CotA-like multicopper oxidase with cupredoxin domain